jgi:hypothetical protein
VSDVVQAHVDVSFERIYNNSVAERLDEAARKSVVFVCEVGLVIHLRSDSLVIPDCIMDITWF